MLDFAACNGEQCPIKGRCKRYRVGQEIIKQGVIGYWVIAGYDLKKNECELFIEEKTK